MKLGNFFYTGNFDLCLFKNRESFLLYLYNGHIFCMLQINKSDCVNVLNKNFIFVCSLVADQKPQNNNLSGLCGFLTQFQLYKTAKIKFSGKGYKLKKTSANSINLMFNRAHITYV